MSTLQALRSSIRAVTLGNEITVVRQHLTDLTMPAAERQQTVELAANWVRELRDSTSPGLMESFLAEYGLSTQEGVALMCMAEAYLRVPDTETLDELIQDKISPQNFAEHLGHSSSLMVNASTWGLMLTGSVLSESDQRGLLPSLHGLVRRAGEPIIRAAVKQMMRMMGGQFVLGESIENAINNGKEYEDKGYRYSFDMLGEAALTQADANRYHLSYADAITELAQYCHGGDVRKNPGISVKLSALYPRYESLHREAVMDQLFPAIRSLCLLAKKAGMGLNIDAEEAERLDLSLDIIEALVREPSLKGWAGLGIVVQAYSYRAPAVLDWLYALATETDSHLMVRLVKGAYWDREIKRSQELGLAGYPVYTRKNNTDLAYWVCAQKLLGQRDRIFPQFATHNAHTIAAIVRTTAGEGVPSALDLNDTQSTQGNAAYADGHSYEFQRLHGMGEALHEVVREQYGIPCRIYAPVGVHRDLLAYLVRRLLENGANASFVSQLLDSRIPPREVTADPVEQAEHWLQQPLAGVLPPADLFQPERTNSQGFDFEEIADIAALEAMRAPFAETQWQAEPLLAEGVVEGDDEHKYGEGEPAESLPLYSISNPATGSTVGSVRYATTAQVDAAVVNAHQAQTNWFNLGVNERAAILNRAADLYEQHAGEIFAILAREAGKTIVDAISELREAVDFLRYYAAQAEHIAPSKVPCGVVACISPWNFPLAIFTGQLSAALAVGNAVLVKPAESTPLIAYRAVSLLHEAGVPLAVLQYLPGTGSTIGSALSAHPSINAMVFTGSTATAKIIEASMSQYQAPDTPLIAETGGLNAMVVDSSALPEQVVVDIINSAFQSAGQRCSALRMLYLQEDIAERTLELLYGAMELLQAGDPWVMGTDLGPVIDVQAAQGIKDYITQHRDKVLKQTSVPEQGHFVVPTVLQVNGIEDLTHEVFGPVLHVATYDVNELERVIGAINAKGYGLTFGLHTRIDSRVQTIVDRLQVGNMYVNRNQIGAIVGSQPFGGEGLSGTGPKAGGPFYLKRLVKEKAESEIHPGASLQDGGFSRQSQPVVEASPPLAQPFYKNSASGERGGFKLQQAITNFILNPDGFAQMHPMQGELAQRYAHVIHACRQQLHAQRTLPGPTGEDNLLSLHPRGLTVIASTDSNIAFQQAMQAVYCGNPVVICGVIFEPAEQTWLEQQENVYVSAEPLAAEGLCDLAGVSNFVFTPEDGKAQRDLASAYRQVLAQREGIIVRYISEVVAPWLYAQERHLCINTTAAGGNVELIANAE